MFDHMTPSTREDGGNNHLFLLEVLISVSNSNEVKLCVLLIHIMQKYSTFIYIARQGVRNNLE